ncbi:MAG: ATP-binding protein [Actinomycetota bacterium]|nr:ATP-binding protein [Actinomycetota bacterium]
MIERTAAIEDEQRALLEAVVENIPAGLVVLDRDGGPVLANAEALRILHRESMDAPELANWRETEAYHLDGGRVQPDEWPMARTLRDGDIIRGERFEVVTAGRHVVLEISSAPVVSASGERTGGLAVLRDVTVAEQTERAERDFVTNAAHELQSPLAAIVSAIDVLQAGAKDGPQRDVFLEHIERATDRLARLVRALLVLARSQIGVEAPRDELVALCPLLKEVCASLDVASTVSVEVACPDELALITNRELLEQAIVNLAENAAKHTATGTIVLTARELEDGRMVEISVVDTGPGISPADRPKVFDRFYRAGSDGHAGFGLGLAIVRAAAEALDGEIELDSTVGAGTIFRLRLPRAAAIVAP